MRDTARCYTVGVLGRGLHCFSASSIGFFICMGLTGLMAHDKQWIRFVKVAKDVIGAILAPTDIRDVSPSL